MRIVPRNRAGKGEAAGRDGVGVLGSPSVLCIRMWIVPLNNLVSDAVKKHRIRVHKEAFVIRLSAAGESTSLVEELRR